MSVTNVVDSSKRCSKCKTLQSVSNFHRRSHGDGYQSVCKRCSVESVREYFKTNPKKKEILGWTQSDARLAKAYGIDGEDWARAYEAQEGKCLGCLNKLLHDRTTHVDHDHSTGAARGLLCTGCNNALGCARDDPSTLRRLAGYLEEAGCGYDNYDLEHDKVWGD